MEMSLHDSGETLVLRVPKGRHSPLKWVPGWSWDASQSLWRLPRTRLAVQILKKHYPELPLSQALLSLLPPTPVLNPKLFPYQVEGVKFLTQTQRALLADDMGLGKTVQALLSAQALQTGLPTLILCPNSLKGTWAKEIALWCPGEPVQVVQGERAARVRQIAQACPWTILNLEAARLHTKDLESIQWGVVIVDEAHRIKNRARPSGRGPQVTRAVWSIALRTPHVFLLTGTPIINRPDEIWSLLHCLDPSKFSSYWKFVERYCEIWDNGYGLEVGDARPDRLQEFQDLLRPYYLRRTKREKLSLPPLQIQQIWVELQGDQKRIYREMAKTMYADLRERGEVSASIVLAQITRLKQITVDPNLMVEAPQASLQGAKATALLDILEGLGQQKAVVFSQFAGAILAAERLLQSRGISCVSLTGAVPADQRQSLVDRFQKDPECQVFLSSIQAGGVGLTLTAASIAVFLDKAWAPAINDQARARLHRVGQTLPVTVIELLAAGTVEEAIESLLARKEEQFQNLFTLDPTSVTSRPLTSSLLKELFSYSPKPSPSYSSI